MTTQEIQTLIQNITGYKTTVSKLKGSMKDYTRFKIKGDIKISDEQAKRLKPLFNNRCFID